MGELVFRHPEYVQQLPVRDWFRQHFPSGRDGYVVEDLDLLIRVYGEQYDTDNQGKFMLVELKFYPGNIGVAQRKTFNLIHSLLRSADPGRLRYVGYYVVQYDNQDWEVSRFWINGQEITKSNLLDFFRFKKVFTGMFES